MKHRDAQKEAAWDFLCSRARFKIECFWSGARMSRLGSFVLLAGILLGAPGWAGERLLYRDAVRSMLLRAFTQPEPFSPEFAGCLVDKLLDRVMLGKSIISEKDLESRVRNGLSERVSEGTNVECAWATASDLDEFRVDHGSLGNRYVLVRGQGLYLMGNLFLKKGPGDLSPVLVDMEAVEREVRLRVIRQCGQVRAACEMLVGGTPGQVAFQPGLIAKKILLKPDRENRGSQGGTSPSSEAVTAGPGRVPQTGHPVAPRPDSASLAAAPVLPSYDCGKAKAYAEQLVCSDRELTYMDRFVAALYWNQVARAPSGSKPPQGRQEQIAWIKARNTCVDRECVKNAYVNRASQLKSGLPAATEGTDLKVRQCMSDSIKHVRPRLDGIDFSTGVVALYESGGIAISYDLEPEVIASKPGDHLVVCLVELPKNCPRGDHRGKLYLAHNLRTGQNWTLQDSQHSCGGA